MNGGLTTETTSLESQLDLSKLIAAKERFKKNGSNPI